MVDEMLNAIAERGSCDLIRDLASALPVELIGDMLGIPRPERAPLRGWSLAILSGLEPRPTSDQVSNGSDAVEEFKDYLRTLVARRLRDAGDDDAEVLSKLIGPDEDGEALSELELLHNCIFLLNAGHETTTNLIGNGGRGADSLPESDAKAAREPRPDRHGR